MTNLTIPDMSCAHCVKTITESITTHEAGAKVDIDLQNRTVSVQSLLSDTEIRNILTQAGYPPAP